MTFHAACARMLRAEAPRLGYTRQFTIYDQADSRRLVKRCIDELGVDPKRFTPGAVQHQISDAKNKLRDAEAYRQLVGSYFEQTVADVYELYERELHRDERDGLRRPARAHGQRARAVPRGPRALRARPSATCWSTSTRTRTTPSTGCCSCCAGRAPQPRGRRRRRSVDLRLPRRRHPQHPRLPGRLPGRARSSSSSRTTARRRRSSSAANAVIAHNRERMGKTLWTDLGEGDPIKRPRARRRARRGALRRRRDRAAGRRGRLARGDRGLLPDERAVAGARGHARARARSATRSSAARSSTSAPRSRTRSPT